MLFRHNTWFVSSDRDLAARWDEQSVQKFEKRCFPTPVRAEKPDDPAAFKGKVYILKGNAAAKFFGQSFCF